MNPDEESSETPKALKMIGVVLFLCFGVLYYKADQQETIDLTSSLASAKQPEELGYLVEDTRILAGVTTELKGTIRNTGREPITGIVKIQVLNFQGDIIGSFKTFLNKQKPVAPGETGTFSYKVASHKVSDGIKLQVTFHRW